MSLTFHWPDYRKVSFALPGFLVVSVAIHGLAFTLFQAVYPPSGSMRPPPASVTILTPSSPGNRAMLNWIDAGDPAIASRPQEVVPPGLLELAYQPSYAQSNVVPQFEASQSPPVNPPSIMDSPGLLGRLARGQSKGKAVVPLPQPTQVRISGQLSGRTPKGSWLPPNLVWSSNPARTLEPAQFLVGVTASGEVAYFFLQHSSGEPKIDREAEAILANARFSPGSELTWGMLSFYWGSDVFAPSGSAGPSIQPDIQTTGL